MTREDALVLEFAAYTLDPEAGLRRRGEAVALPPKVAPSAEPFEMLQQARELLGMMMAPEIDAALVAVERIDERCLEYAPARSFRADLHVLRGMRRFGLPRANGNNARVAAKRAIALDPGYFMARGYHALALIAAGRTLSTDSCSRSRSRRPTSGGTIARSKWRATPSRAGARSRR